MRVRATGPAPVVNSAFGLAMLEKFGWARRAVPHALVQRRLSLTHSLRAVSRQTAARAWARTRTA